MRSYRVLLMTLALASVCLLPLTAQDAPPPPPQGTGRMGPMGMPGQMAARGPRSPLKPDYQLASRFMPEEMGQLVFDTSVTPHWFNKSDKFWYSYKTPAGTSYTIVDPATRVKHAIWDDAKLAQELSLQTNLPYDAQHLDLQGVHLLDDDSAIQFSISVRQDARIPGESAASLAAAIAAANAGRGGGEGDNAQGGGGGRGGGGAALGSQPMRDVYFTYNLATGALTRLDNYTPDSEPLWATVSPDKQSIFFARGDNLYMMDAANYAKAKKDPADATIQETQITTDGVPKYSYARALTPEVVDAIKKADKKDADNPKGMRVPAVGIHFSQDNKKFALTRLDDRKVADLWVIHSLATPRPELETYSYAMPGEANDSIGEVQIYTLGNLSQRVLIPEKDFPLVDPTVQILDAPETSAEREHAAEIARQRARLNGQDAAGGGRGGGSHWLAGGSDKLYVTVMARDFRDYDLAVIDTTSGAVKTIIQETGNDWLDAGPNDGAAPIRLLDHGNQVLWWSERDGWAHYYSYDTATGKQVHQITSGTWQSNQLVGIDEAANSFYFLGNGRDSKINPYYMHLYRTSLDGSGLTDLTPGDFDVAASGSDDGKVFVTNASRVDTAPVSSMVDGQGAALHLETTDVSRLMAAGYKYPIPFSVKAADGITDLYGVMYEPFNLDPTRKYPIIEYVYPGPQTESVTAGFSPKNASVPLAQMGFIVVEVGNRGGSPQRDKWYDAFGYGNLRDYGLADKREAVIELGEKYPFIDTTKVGIWGHSGGGFMTAAALLQYPTFFTAGWSESGNHDNNNYNRSWSEKYDGVRQQKETNGEIKFIYDIEKNEDLAANLQGHLMLTTGDMDNNVSMVNTMQLANALIHADKRFEMLVFPGMRHPYTPINDYVLARRMDFFAHWLLGATDDTADILLLQNEKQHTPSRKFIE